MAREIAKDLIRLDRLDTLYALEFEKTEYLEQEIAVRDSINERYKSILSDYNKKVMVLDSINRYNTARAEQWAEKYRRERRNKWVAIVVSGIILILAGR